MIRNDVPNRARAQAKRFVDILHHPVDLSLHLGSWSSSLINIIPDQESSRGIFIYQKPTGQYFLRGNATAVQGFDILFTSGISIKFFDLNFFFETNPLLSSIHGNSIQDPITDDTETVQYFIPGNIDESFLSIQALRNSIFIGASVANITVTSGIKFHINMPLYTTRPTYPRT